MGKTRPPDPDLPETGREEEKEVQRRRVNQPMTQTGTVPVHEMTARRGLYANPVYGNKVPFLPSMTGGHSSNRKGDSSSLQGEYSQGGSWFSPHALGGGFPYSNAGSSGQMRNSGYVPDNEPMIGRYENSGGNLPPPRDNYMQFRATYKDDVSRNRY